MRKVNVVLTWCAVVIVAVTFWIVLTSKKVIVIEPTPVAVETVSPTPFYPCFEGDKC